MNAATVPPVLSALPAADGPAQLPKRRPGTTRPRDDWRLVLVIFAFIMVYGAVAVRMATMATDVPSEPHLARDAGAGLPVRREITDRDGNLLAANLPAYSLYAHPDEIKDIPEVARELATVFTDTTPAEFHKILTRSTKFVWVRRPITPTERQEVLDLGQPGLLFGSRMMRIYPAGRVTSHIMGGVRAAAEGVDYAELVGAGGVEGYFDKTLRDPARFGTPLELSLDLSVQNALRDVLAAGVDEYHAKGAAGVLMNVHTGEILALVSLPDFDPNAEPKPFKGPAGMNPRFDRAVQGLYELGSTFKVLTAAEALQLGLVTPDTMIDTGTPVSYKGRPRIHDMHHMPDQLSVTDVLVRSSNVGAAHLAMAIGTPRFKDYLKRMGMFDPLPLELSEARGAAPLLPPKWTDLSTMTISYGHGLSVSPVHLAAAYATIANGGRRVEPTLRKGGLPSGARILSEKTSRQMMQIIRQVVARGTGRRTDIPGYSVGGKTGTADKPKPTGGYYKHKVISSFASVFPTNDPQYTLVISLDEPSNTEGKYTVREASATAVPVTAKAIERIAPLLDMRPQAPVVADTPDAPQADAVQAPAAHQADAQQTGAQQTGARQAAAAAASVVPVAQTVASAATSLQ